MPAPATEFPGSGQYWETRYRSGGNSGAGSYNRLAHYKATIINDFVEKNSIRTVIEYGCGDGNQLGLARYPEYLGFDVSSTAVARCRARFENDTTKTFRTADTYAGEIAELILSLDVIYHLIEDEVFDAYMARLFASSSRFVIIYSSNNPDYNAAYAAQHVKHRVFTEWVSRMCPGWKLADNIPNLYPFMDDDPHNTSLAEFFVYKKALFKSRLRRSPGRHPRTATDG